MPSQFGVLPALDAQAKPFLKEGDSLKARLSEDTVLDLEKCYGKTY